MRHKSDLLTIGEMAERSGVAPSALRYYESQGLITSTRTTGNQRRYERAMLRRVSFIRSAQRVGLSLEEITEALSTLPGGRTPTKADWTRLSGHLAGPDQRPDRPARAAAGPAGQLHRLRLPEPGNRCTLSEPGRLVRSRGPGRCISNRPRTETPPDGELG